MKGYFNFDWSSEDDVQERVDFRFLFKSPGILKHGDLADAIEVSVRTIAFPDVIVIVCMGSEFDDLLGAFKSPDLNQAANRVSTKIGLCVCSFDRYGAFDRVRFIRNKRYDVKGILKNGLQEVKIAGLRNLFSASHVSVYAPPGFVFYKPSGERSVLFLKTEEAITDIERVHFLGFSLLDRIAKREKEVGAPIDVIYIDSMGIAPVAYELREMYCSLFEAAPPRVISFHSHDGFRSLDSPLPGTSLCLISASSSMHLESKWREKTHCYPTEVVTLLTLENACGSSNALFALPSKSSVQWVSKATGGVLRDLRITGERFSTEELSVKKVLLRQPVHRVGSANRFSKIFRGCNKLFLHKRAHGASARVRPIFLRGESLLEDDGFKSYLEKIISQKVPASVQAIVFQDDDSSKRLAEWCQIKLLELIKRPIKLISQDDLYADGVNINKNDAIIIISAVVGKGTKLLSVSRDLRALHVGARVYVIGAQLAETQNQITMLQRNLVYSAEKANIIVERFCEAALGMGLSDSFADECEVLQRFPENIRLEGPVSQRLEKLRSGDGLSVEGFLPCESALEGHLKLRPDFAYWDFKYAEGDDNLPAVLLTVASIVQHAREGRFDAQDDWLGTEAFQQVILDPENFSRYNDGVIQAALLRAAHASELDYSSERGASQYLLSFLIKIFAQHERPQGEAALEFALALNTGRLRLSEEDAKILRDSVRESLSGDSLQKMVLRILLGIEESKPDVDSLPSEF